MIDEDFKDALGEIINIAFGSSTAIIADLFENFATLNVPDIAVIPMGELEAIVAGGMEYENIYITTQQFKGTFEGEVLFAIDSESAGNMQNLIYKAEGFDDVNALDEIEIKQSILEISNILGASCIGKFAELLKADALFSPPVIEPTHELLGGLTNTMYSKIIVISTVLAFQESRIHGRLFIMFNNEMFGMLESRLRDFWGEM